MYVFPLRRIPCIITVFPGATTSAAALGMIPETDSRINARFDKIISLMILIDIILHPYLKDGLTFICPFVKDKGNRGTVPLFYQKINRALSLFHSTISI